MTFAPFELAKANDAIDWLCVALPDMMATDIARTKAFTVVNRFALKNVLEEQMRSVQVYTDEKMASKLGRLVGAQYIVVGRIIEIGANLRLDVQLTDVEKGSIIGAASVMGGGTRCSSWKRNSS